MSQVSAVSIKYILILNPISGQKKGGKEESGKRGGLVERHPRRFEGDIDRRSAGHPRAFLWVFRWGFQWFQVGPPRGFLRPSGGLSGGSSAEFELKGTASGEGSARAPGDVQEARRTKLNRGAPSSSEGPSAETSERFPLVHRGQIERTSGDARERSSRGFPTKFREGSAEFSGARSSVRQVVVGCCRQGSQMDARRFLRQASCKRRKVFFSRSSFSRSASAAFPDGPREGGSDAPHIGISNGLARYSCGVFLTDIRDGVRSPPGDPSKVVR